MGSNGTPRRLAVLGSPIAHSRSPLLHAAAYRALGLEWRYEAVEVAEHALPGFIAGLDDSWLGLSLTMPLKREVIPLLDRSDDLVGQTGSANTVLFERLPQGLQLAGFNTDVFGIAQAFRRHGHSRLREVQIIGGGATAASAIAAVAGLGARSVQLSVRSPARAVPLIRIGAALGVAVTIGPLDGPGEAPDAIISTLPGAAATGLAFADATVRGAVLFDVAYHPWPSPLAARWQFLGGDVIGGLEMLVLQALAQVRIFRSGDPELALDGEDEVLGAMRTAVGL